uniref:Ubiquitin-associated protein 2-like n=1 Tax=Sinocyclocheilus anshuiensis TaxID=1608454 RepID=A0A671MTI0_9TELE
MMTSVGVERARGTRDKALPTTTQTTQPQKHLQATAEQIRLAQMIYDKNDADFEDKVKQLMEVTGKNQDDCMVALHDCNEDVNRAINFLLEGTSDATSWETVGKKKSLGKDATSTESKENKENREKKERESSKGRGGASRRGRGTSRNRPGDSHLRPCLTLCVSSCRTFNPADYTTDRRTSNSHADVWETGANDTTDGTGKRPLLHRTYFPVFRPTLISLSLFDMFCSVAWQNTLDEWAAEDWSEDLSETKVFTSSCAPPTENPITPGQSLDLSTLLQKPVDREEVGGLKAVGSSQGLGHSLVFTNSHHQPARNGGTSAGSNSYTHATLSSVLGSGFGELGGPKLGQTAGQQILEQLKGPGLGQLTSQPSSTGTNCTPVGGLFQMQPEPSLVLSKVAQRHPPTLCAPSPAPGTLEAFPKAPETSQHRDGPSMAPSQTAESQGSSTHQRQIKTQKRRIPPTSKIPASAVEMPGSADVSGLNVQFGALDFGSESALPDFGQSENCNSEPIREAVVVPQSQSSLYSKPIRSVSGRNGNTESSTSSSSTPKQESPSLSSSTSVAPSAPSSLLPPSVTPHSSALPSLASELSSSNHKLLYPFELRGKSAILHSPKTLPCLCAGKTPPNLSQGVPPLLPNQYIMGPGGLLPAYPVRTFLLLNQNTSVFSPLDYYGITFPGPTATLSGRDGSLASNPYSGDVTKFGRGESTSPAPSTNLSAAHAPQTVQAQSQGQNQHQPQGHHNTQQPFLNPALHPGYSYTGLPYYPGVPGMPSAFQYGPTMFVPPASAKQHGMGLSNPTTPFQQPSGYGQHAFSSGYDDLTQGPAGTEYSKGYSNSSQTQAKSAASGPGKGVSVTSSNSGVPDISGTVYNKTQPFDKQGFHAGTPPPFSLPSALGGTGPLTPGAAPGYAPAPFLHILPAHQQPHSQLLHHHLTQDGQGGLSQRSQSSTMQQKTQVNKSNYGSSPYWGN